MTGALAIKIEGLGTGQATPFDGEYVKEFDPGRDGTDPDGTPMFAHVVTTPELAEAVHFPGVAEAHAFWTLVDPRQPVRADGRPNRPLTAFTVTFEAVDA